MMIPKSIIQLVILNILLTMFTQNSMAEASRSFQFKKTEKIGLISLEWVKEKQSGFSFFRIRSGLEEKQLSSINKVLKDIQNEYADFYINCLSPNEGQSTSHSNVEDLTASLQFLSENLISFSVRSSYFCKGMARPNFEKTNFVYNLKTAKKVTLNDVLSFSPSTKLETNAYLGLDQQNILTPYQIRALVFINEGWDINTDVEPDSCNYTQLNAWNVETWAYTKQGLDFTPSFPMIDRMVCHREFQLSFAQLYRYKKANFVGSFD